MTVEELKAANGGHWGSHPKFTVARWMDDVSAGNTRLGYWEWMLEELLEAAL